MENNIKMYLKNRIGRSGMDLYGLGWGIMASFVN
jgi:hypothetical protein